MIRGATALILATALAAGPVAAQPAGGLPCLDRPTARALVALVLPTIADAAVRRCAASPDAPVIAREGSRLAARLQPQADAAWPAVRAWVLGSTAPELESARRTVTAIQDGASARGLLSAFAAGPIFDQIKPENCAAIDAIVDPLTTLSAEEAAAVVSGLVQATVLNGKGPAGLRACPAAQAAPPAGSGR
ncbi:MAG: hypothetical protein RQ833_00975 [Sphingomonadaceae bacterium]|nr:hypothetical protein [Sphingomonadaceae bacterium]